MQDYKIRDQWLTDSNAKQNTNLWARFGKAKPSNVKLRYLLADVFGQDSENFSYLWVPPTHAYYAGNGIFEPRVP